MVVSPVIFDTSEWRALNRPARYIYLYLVARADASGVCWPSLSRIAGDTSMNRRSIIRAVAECGKTGLLSKGGAPGKVQKYQIIPVSELTPVTKELPVSKMTPVTKKAGTGDNRDTAPVSKEIYEHIKNSSKNRKESEWI